MKKSLYVLLCAAALVSCGQPKQQQKAVADVVTSGNPIFEGWYADPEGIIYGDTYWVFPTWSDAYEKQTYFDCFSSKDLVNWTKHSSVLDTSAVKWAKKGKSAVEIASMYGILRITPITPEVIRISFVKGVTAKVQDTYWKPKADTAFPWSAKESKTAVLVETEKLRVMVEKKDGAVQFLTPDNNPILSVKRDEPRMIDGGMTWTFFDWSGSEKLKAKGILSTEWLDLTAKARYVSFGGKQARMPLLVSNRGYGIAAAASRTALLCNVRTFGTYLHTAGDGQIDYYFILGKDREEIVKQYKEL